MSKINSYAQKVDPHKISSFIKETKNMVNEVETMLEVTSLSDQNIEIAKIFSKYGLI